MTISTLDKWMEEEPEPSKYTHIFINVNELNYEFGSRDKVVNYEKLLKWVKKMWRRLNLRGDINNLSLSPSSLIL